MFEICCGMLKKVLLWSILVSVVNWWILDWCVIEIIIEVAVTVGFYLLLWRERKLYLSVIKCYFLVEILWWRW